MSNHSESWNPEMMVMLLKADVASSEFDRLAQDMGWSDANELAAELLNNEFDLSTTYLTDSESGIVPLRHELEEVAEDSNITVAFTMGAPEGNRWYDMHAPIWKDKAGNLWVNSTEVS